MKKQSIQKIPFAYQPGQQFLELRLDPTLRRIFSRAAKQGRRFYRDEANRAMADQVASVLKTEWGIGLDVLDKLAYVPSTLIHLTWMDVHLGLAFACSASMNLAVCEEDIAPLAHAIILLADLAPMRVPHRRLTPAREIWPDGKVAESVRQSYENIRLHTLEEYPLLYIAPGYKLHCELVKLNSPDPEIQLLIQDLGKATASFSFTLKRLAMSEALKLGEAISNRRHE